MVGQKFKAHVPRETYVILGNDAILKCEIPSFVADLVFVDSWIDSEGQSFLPSKHGKDTDWVFYGINHGLLVKVLDFLIKEHTWLKIKISPKQHGRALCNSFELRRT